MQTVNARVAALRQWMAGKGIAAFITPSTDPHQGEYVPNHWKGREWISGFTGSAGTAVVTTSEAALWTDNRYFLQAAEQLSGTDYVLMKIGLEGTPTIGQWLKSLTPQPPLPRRGGDQQGNQQEICTSSRQASPLASPSPWERGLGGEAGVDAKCWSLAALADLRKELSAGGIALVDVGDPYEEIWPDRPSLPLNPVEIQPLEYAGERAASKIARIREALPHSGEPKGAEEKPQGAEGKPQKAEEEPQDAGLLISALDEVAWTLNLRGSDVDYNPVFVSYLLIAPTTATLYVNAAKLPPAVVSYLAGEGVGIAPYEDAPLQLRCDETPVRLMKCMKNETEIQGYRSCMLRDGIAMVKWMKWVIPAVAAGGQTELSLAEKLEAFRAEQPLFRGLSFESIMGYGHHAAIVHYEPTPETDIPVEPHGLLLIDSGGQYQDGTTDITRTIPLGSLTDEERQDYTLVLRGFIDIGRAVFPRGTYGSQLDVLARAAMWQYGTNYLHGTGHGVGSFLNVHEGPHQFRMNYMPTPLLPGMTITDEPGIYIAGSHGVRHENTMLVVPHSEGRTFGPYYTFEHLTLCPILTTAIVREMLTQEEADWFNQYQQTVYARLSPHLDAEHRQWLREVTKAI